MDTHCEEEEISWSSDSDDDCFFADTNTGSLEPYQFEPLCSSEEEDSNVENSDLYRNDDWCCCQHCEGCNDIKEKICCRSPMIFDDDVFDGKMCIVESEAFESVCLNKYVLQAAIGAWKEYNYDKKGLDVKNYRFLAYRQYIAWSHGYLGKKRRRPLPNCVIIAIRKRFPDPNNIYVPYSELT